MPEIEKEILLHKNLFREYQKRYGSAFAKIYLDWWDNLIIKPIMSIKKGVFLDCGCGTGDLTEKIAEARKNDLIVGLDVSREMIGNKKRKANTFWVVGNANNLPFKNASFDVVICKETLHHLSSPQEALFEFSRVLKKKGWLLLSDPCDNSLILRILRRICFKFMKKFNPGHAAFRKSQLNCMLKKSGFRVINQYYFGYIAYPLCGLSDILPLLKFLPFSVLITKWLIKLDIFLSKIPLLRENSWLIITHAQKKA